MIELYTALAIGFAGSFHCIGMCGPIAAALPVGNSGRLSFIAGRLLYNTGRLLAYSLMGALFGLLGGHIIMSGFQQILSITLGVIIILTVILPPKYRAAVTGVPAVSRIIQPLKSGIGRLFRKDTFASLFLIGFLNGFLPCGFVYIGLAGAAASGNAVLGGAFMFLFGMGTVPAMMVPALSGKFLTLNARRRMTKAVPYLALLFALIFILRGMALGIPYISPKISQPVHTGTLHHCG